MIEGDGRLVAPSDASAGSDYKRGDPVFHIKFGYGAVRAVDGNKLTMAFEKAGEKRVIESFVEKAESMTSTAPSWPTEVSATHARWR